MRSYAAIERIMPRFAEVCGVPEKYAAIERIMLRTGEVCGD
ncbi:hypothetical protein QT711_04765 [Sporosarcina saromensis]|uniref:Uncharacterized protein n=1 Tax=Sporosarcina saromensis TaxID=359365 RepID=A0ABU4G7Y9_9BACL|nr:hypothetical protein [Sporosarcina saromensis]MDW0112487.1 hypothetical protein [Sporosarcina saromensis]